MFVLKTTCYKTVLRKRVNTGLSVKGSQLHGKVCNKCDNKRYDERNVYKLQLVIQQNGKATDIYQVVNPLNLDPNSSVR